jgi:hypothetical protein
MKIRYQRWQCACCDKVERIPENPKSNSMPYWFNIKTTTYGSSNNHPSFDIFTCSTECLKKVGESIQKSIANYKHSIPRRNDYQVTICDQCGKIVMIDQLHARIGGRNPLDGWTWREAPKGRFDFCSMLCEHENIHKPQEAIFFDFDFENYEIYLLFDKNPTIDIIESPDFKEALIVLKEKLKKAFRWPPLKSEI